MNLNKVMLAGRLTRDPELKELPSGNSVTNLGFATNRVFKSGNEKKEEATFIDIKAWGVQGEQIAQYLKKGSPLFIEGRLTLESWESNGDKRSKLVVTMENYKFISEGKKDKEDKEDKDDLGF
ncbi:MAG TPA: single-stranded DNA-binding protein [Planctomycetaceae bacterium]|nr:single-stranded DNA-binding protein [Planctomycetaceae bacterium]